MYYTLMFYLFSVSPRETRLPSTSGFSLVELLVSIGIVVMVLSLVVANQQAFNSAVLLRGQAYEIALAMREVQLGAVSAVSDGTGEFRSNQGIYFDLDISAQQYRLFRDAPGPGAISRFWNAGEDIGLSGLLDNRFEVRGFEMPPGTAIGNQLSITFERPNFDATFVTSNSGTIIDEQAAIITIGLRGGSSSVCGEDIRQIEVRSTGQIAVLEC
jgi:type II secretory pathway pseudopilin PulG